MKKEKENNNTGNNEKFVEENKNIEKKEPITEAVLTFIRDRNDRNWISRLSEGESAGKIVLLHRSDQTIPQPNIQYLCQIQEKEKEIDGKKIGYALSWIVGLAGYPRVVIKSDKSCVVIEHPNEKKKPKNYSDIFEALMAYPKLEYFFTIYRTENRKEEINDPSLLRDVSIEIKIKSGDESSMKANIKRERLRSSDLKMIIDDIKKDIQ